MPSAVVVDFPGCRRSAETFAGSAVSGYSTGWDFVVAVAVVAAVVVAAAAAVAVVVAAAAVAVAVIFVVVAVGVFWKETPFVGIVRPTCIRFEI